MTDIKMKNLCFILIFQAFIFAVIETRKYGIELDQYDFGNFKKVVDSDPTGTNSEYPPANHITNRPYTAFTEKFSRINLKSFTLTIDLQYSINIQRVGIKFQEGSLNNIDEIKLKTENEISLKVKISDKQLTKFSYECFGIYAKYVIIEVINPTVKSKIERVYVISQRLDLLRQSLLVESINEAMHPFSNYNKINIAGFRFSENQVFSPEQSIEFMKFDNTPMAWFLLKLHSPSYVLTYIIECENHFPETFLAFGVDDSRDLDIYMEDNGIKVFTVSTCQPTYHHFQNPFVARFIQIYMLSKTPDFKSRIDFRGFVANPLPEVHNVIHVHSIVRAEHEISINLPNVYRISGIQFSRTDVLQQFCLKYKSRSGQVEKYQDNVFSTEATIFFGNVKIHWFQLKAFIAREFILSCLKWNSIGLFLSQMTISIRGEDFNLASHRWITSEKLYDEKKKESLFYVFSDPGSDISLYGNMKSLVKKAPNERLRSDIIGSECLTRPWLCKYGFTVAFQIYGQLDAVLNWDKRYLTAEKIVEYRLRKSDYQHIFKTNPKNYFKTSILYLASTMYATSIRFHNSYMSTYADIKGCFLNIPLSSDSSKIFKLSIFVGFDFDDLLSYIQNSSVWNHDYSLDLNAGKIHIDLTDKVNEAFRLRKYGKHLQHFVIMIGVGSNLNNPSHDKIELNWKQSVLSFQRRIKVPKKMNLQEGFKWDNNINIKKSSKSVVVSGIETTLEGNYKLSFDTSHASKLSVGKKFYESGLQDTFRNERRYMPLSEPIAVNEIDISDENGVRLASTKDAKIYGADLDYDSEEVLPIISCGIHGNDTVNQGTGFSIFYTSKELYGVVKTDEKQYTIKVPLTHLQQDQWNSVVLRWNKADNKIKLNVNSHTEENTTPITLNNISKPIYGHEYLLLFGQYHYQEAYSYGHFRKFSIWRYPIEDGQINTFKDQKNDHFSFSPNKMYGEHFHPSGDCSCENVICPCHESVKLQPSIEQIYEVKKYPVTQISEDNTVENTTYVWTNYDIETDEHFIEFETNDNELHVNQLNDVRLAVDFSEPLNNITNVTICNENSNYLYCTNTSLYLGQTNFQSENLNFMLVDQLQKLKKEAKKNIKFLLNTGFRLNMSDAKMKVHLQAKSVDQGIIAYAHEREASVWKFSYPLLTKCIHFTYQFEGNGFAYVSISDVDGLNQTFQSTRIYLNENFAVENNFEYKINENFSEIKIVVMKNFLGDGYFMLKKLMFSLNDCTNAAIKSIQESNQDKDINKMLLKTFSTLPTFYLHPNHLSSDTSSIPTLFPIQDYFFYSNGEYTFQTPTPLISLQITMVFWYFHKSSFGGDILKLHRIHKSLDVFQMLKEGNLLKFKIQGSHYPDLDLDLALDTWHFMQIFIFEFKYLRIVVKGTKREIIHTYLGTLKGYTTKLQLETGYIACYLFYHKYLLPLELEQAKLCLKKYSIQACPGEPKRCAVCSQMKGMWVPREDQSHLVDINCKHVAKDIPMTYYFPFDEVVNNSYHDIALTQQIPTISGHVTAVNHGIIGAAVHFTGAKDHVILEDKCSNLQCYFSSWMKHRCTKNITVLTGKEFALKCFFYEEKTTNHLHMILETRSCSYVFYARNGLWYHLIIVINGQNVNIQIDGVEIVKNESCIVTYQSSSSQLIASTTNNDWLIMDEFAMNQENPFSFPLVDMVEKHFMGRDFPKLKFPNYWLKFIQDVEWNEDYNIRGHKKQEYLLQLIEKTLSSKYGIIGMSMDRANLTVDKDSDSKACIRAVVTLSPKDHEMLLNGTWEGFMSSVGDAEDQVSDYQASMEHIKLHSTANNIKIDKTFMIFNWIEPTANIVPLKGLYITALHDQLDEVNETSYDIDFVTISSLKGYTEYEICIAPIPLLSDFPDNYFKKCYGKFKTLEAEPYEEPALNCTVSSETDITCIVYNINIISFAGVPYSYHLYSVKTNEMNETHLSVNEWNLQNFTKQEQHYVQEQREYIFQIETHSPYELYTIVTMATTQSGYGLGVRNNNTIRSHEGAPDVMPVLISVTATNRSSLVISWKTLEHDEEVWNSLKKSQWLYEVFIEVRKFYTTDIQNLTETVSYLKDNIEVFLFDRVFLIRQIFQVHVKAKNEFGKSDVGNSLCVLFPDLGPYIPKWSRSKPFLLGLEPLMNSNSWNISVGSFRPVLWRGKRSYLIFAQAVNHSMLPEENITAVIKENGCQAASTNYWLKIFCKPFNITKNVEHYIGEGTSCNETEFKEYSRQNNLEKTFTLDNFHPYTLYLLYVFSCNEIGCYANPLASEYLLTHQHKPGAGPDNITLSVISSTMLNLTFGLIDSFYQHGEIQGYHMILSCVSLNTSRYINETNNLTVTTFEGLGKYENCCIVIAGFTSYPALGNYSDPICNRTFEDIPQTSPSNIRLTHKKSRSIIAHWDAFDSNDWNGIPLHFTLNYTCYLRNNSIEQYQYKVKPHLLRYRMRNLYPYTICGFFVSACTKIGCNASKIKNFTSPQDVPTACPLNITLINKTSTCLTFSWNDIEIMNQNGVIQAYRIVVEDKSSIDDKNVTTKNVTFCNLIKFHDYKVSIAGITSAGIGEKCTSTHSTDEDLPCAPSNITLSSYYTDYLIVEWEDVPLNCENGNILGFVIFYYEVTKNDAISPPIQLIVKDKALRTKNVGNVTAGSTYNVSVAAFTTKGIGELSVEKQKQLGVRVNGNWTDWTRWTPCSASCGPAFKLRTRDCVNPVPSNGGLNCSGKGFETDDCNHDPCSGYVLASPGQYDCNEFCKSREMLCTPYMDTDFNLILKDIKVDCGNNKGDKNYLEAKHPGIMFSGSDKTKCVGYENTPNKTVCTIPNNPDEEQYRRICHCIHQNDIGYGPWGQWSICTITCGDSHVTTRSRVCSKEKCWGPSEQSTNCKVPPCPVDGNWGQWTSYEICSKTCGYGFQSRRRFCNNPTPRYQGRNCTGSGIDMKPGCNVHLCPVHGNWGSWSDWSGFKKPCGNSTLKRFRYCDNPAPDHKGRPCVGNKTEKSYWKRHPCKENNVHITIKLGKKRFVYTMNYLNHPDTLKFSNYICVLVKSIALNTTSVYNCRLISIWKGSVNVDFSVTFHNVDAEQLVHVFDVLEMEKMYGEYSLDSVKINTTTVPCPPPSNIIVEEKSGGLVNISFKINQCYDGKMPFQIYVFYIDNKMSSQLDTWEWTGIFGNGSSHIVINDLNPMVKYRARLLESSELGNGIPSDAIYFSSPAGPPLAYPPNLRHISMSPTSIFIEWTDLPVIYRNGELLGYKVMYKQYFHPKYMEKIISFGFKNTILEDLKPFTLHTILVCAFNRGGNGPTDFSVVKTLEGVPSIPVPNVIVTDMLALDWWFVTWSQIPDEYVNGELIGYRLKYYLSYRSGQPIGGEKNEVKYDFDIYTFRHEERNLLSYATYNVTVTGFTKSGEGPTPEYFAKTCHCPEKLFGNWYINTPYTRYENNELGGIFPELIKDMIIEACGSCHNYKRSEVYFRTSKTPLNPNSGTELELKRRISDEVDVSFPLYGRKEIEAIVPDSVFISIVSSPGCALIIRNETNVEGILNNMIMGVISVWPLLLVSYAIATLFGILVWFTDQTENPEEFNLGSSFRGPCIGFWFSFVTMTTVGYGDITPRSILAKSISMVWFLTGLVLNGIVVGFITSAVTSINIVEEHSLYNTLTGTVNNTFEQRYAVMRNAKMEDTYTTVDDVLDALSYSKVDAALIDIYSMASYKPILKKKQLKVVSLIDARTGYGLALSGMAQVLKPDVESLVIEKQNIIGAFVQSLEDVIPELTIEQAGSASADIFSATSPAFITSCLYMGILIGCLSIIGIIVDRVLWCRKRMKVAMEKSAYDELEECADDLLAFCTRTEEIYTQRDTDDKKELAQLALYQRAYSNKVEAIGKERAEKIVKESHIKKGVSTFSASVKKGAKVENYF